jgi:hypothetical protein
MLDPRGAVTFADLFPNSEDNVPNYSEILRWEPIAYFLTLPSPTQSSVAFVLLLTIFFHATFSQKTVSYAPTILTTTGIFFTFLGIALGLAHFDTENIQASIPALLGGLKTAFWASVAGVGGALTIKFRHFFFGVKRDASSTESEEEVTALDLARLLGGIQQALVGQDEDTLISQIKLSRQDTNDRLDALRKAQNEALQKLSEMGSKALVEALRDVIQDFNSRLTEQFGENFKQLNEAVGRLLSWQDRYKNFVDEITLRLVQNINSMTTATANYTELVGKAETFSKISQDLSGLLSSLEVQKQQLAGSLKALTDLLQAASGSLPQIETKVMELTGQLSTAVRQTTQEVGRTIAENSLLLRTSAQEATKQIATGVAEQQKELSKALAENVLLIRNSIQGVNQDFTKVNQDFNKQMNELATKTKEQVAVLDAALAEELKKSLESLGRQLAALSEKFVSDYGPLTDKLKLLVNAARG